MMRRTGDRILVPVALALSLAGACGSDPVPPARGQGDGGVHPPVKTDVFVSRDGVYDTYRIPALAATTRGTLLAFCEGRKKNAADHGDIDLLLRRSFDRGATWGPAQQVWEDGNHTIGNPSPVVDRETGVVWLGFTRDNDRVFVTRSADDGATWDPPAEITQAVKPEGWGWYATGPGHGIQLAGGRLLIPCDHSAGGAQHSHVIVSDDHGATWGLGGSADAGTDECMAVERPDGTLYLTMRNSLFRWKRAFSVSADRGESWSPAEPAEPLLDPVCQASIVGLAPSLPGGPHRILFLNPAGIFRMDLTLRVSCDGAVTWPVQKQIEDGPSAYSDMAPLAAGEVAALYEAGPDRPYQRITFARISLAWVEAP